MDTFRKLTKQTPWRTQQQLLGFVLVGLVFLAMVAGIYLNVTSRAAVLGREMQLLNAEIVEIKRTNAALETELGELLSYDNMERRALAMGFSPTNQQDITYVPIPGYVAPQPIDLSGNWPMNDQRKTLPVAYTQSLWDWLEMKMANAAYASGGGR